jgi:uncharacterized protein
VAEPDDTLALLDYRRRVAALYRQVREGADDVVTWQRWRAGRDELLKSHQQSALPPEARAGFTAAAFFDHDPQVAVEGRVEVVDDHDPVELAHSDVGSSWCRPFGRVRFRLGEAESALTVFWLETYGGGLFLPFRDATSGTETYGGGRYLLDTAKGADLGGAGRRLRLDFNYAYHPSCVWDDRWSCPLAPAENTLDVAVRAGELLPT